MLQVLQVLHALRVRLAAVLGGVVLTALGLWGVLGQPLPMVGLLGPWGDLAAGVGLLAAALVQVMAESAFSVASLDVEGPVRAGGSAVVVLRLTPKRALRVDRAASRLTLKTTELRVFSRRRSTDTVVHQEDLVLELPPTLDSRLEMRLAVAIAPSLPPSHRSYEHTVRTVVLAVIGLEGRPNLHLGVEVEVWPR